MKLWLAVVLLAAGFVSSARAQDEVLLVCEGECAALDLDRVGTRVGEETSTVVRLAIEPGAARATLYVSVADADVAIRLARSDGSTMERTAQLPPERPERTETVAILLVNMLRDESSELLALLRPPRVEPAAPSTTEAVLVVEATEPPSTPETVEPTEPAVVVPVEPPTEVEVPSPPRDPFMRLGLSAQLGSISQGTGFEVDFLAGFEVAWTPLPFLAFGMREIGAGSDLYGDAWHLGAAPFAEVAYVLSFASFYADLGANVQVVLDDALQSSAYVGVAPMLTVGVRARLVPEVSLGLESSVRVVATDSFYTGLHRLPYLAVPWTGGISLLFHIS